MKDLSAYTIVGEKVYGSSFTIIQRKENIYQLIDSVAEFLNSINFNKSYLIGESLGGLVTELFMKEHPNDRRCGAY